MQENTEINPQEYNKLLSFINLNDVYLKDLKVALISRDFEGGANLTFSEKSELVENENNCIKIQVYYEIQAKSKRRNLFKLSAQYFVLFNSTQQIPAGFFDIFIKHSLPLQTFPYFRELVNSVISRMGLPPLILPLRKYLIGEGK